MSKASIIEQTAAHVKQTFSGEGSGHDWWHIYRVWQNAQHVGQAEGDVDLYIVELAALLHDIADWKFHDGDLDAGPRAARQWLESLQVEESIIAHVCEIIANLSFKGAGEKVATLSREGQVVQDADRLDAIGAVGIARTFAYGGHKSREMYNPDEPPQHHQTFEQYRANQGSTINHFYEKLLLLRDRMNTATARQLADERHTFMEQFLDRFFREWAGEA